jgi:PAS domain S-box-containing protein
MAGKEKTKYKQAEENLQAKAAVLQNIISNIPYCIFWKDKNSVYLACNDNFAKFAGVQKPEDITGKSDYDLPWKKEEADFYRKIDKEVMSEGKLLLNIEEPVHQADGRESVVLTSKVPLRNAEGKVTGVLGIFTDITERKLAGKKIKKAAEEWEKTFNALSDLVFIQDADYTIARMNKAFADALKSKPEDIIGKKCYELLHKRDTPWPGCPFEKTRKDKKPHTGEIYDPNIGIPLLVTTSPVFDDKGDIIACVHIAKDISEMKKACKELKKKVRDLEIFHKVAVDRELKMAELKRRIKQLEAELRKEKDA